MEAENAEKQRGVRKVQTTTLQPRHVVYGLYLSNQEITSEDQRTRLLFIKHKSDSDFCQCADDKSFRNEMKFPD